jgi:SAM-dependent methyltransferase
MAADQGLIMSSPIANRDRTPWQRFLVRFHQVSAHTNRISRLATYFGEAIDRILPRGSSEIRGLDVGCGDMSLAETIESRNPRIQWTCADIHELPPDYISLPRWEKYRKFDGKTLPFPAHSFDVVIFSDVFHHCIKKAPELLAEATRVGRYVVVKDHFEYGWYSRQVLRLMDFVGNYGYGVAIPLLYFTQEEFQQTCEMARAKIIQLQIGLDLYPNNPILRHFLRRDWQFMAVLTSEMCPKQP